MGLEVGPRPRAVSTLRTTAAAPSAAPSQASAARDIRAVGKVLGNAPAPRAAEAPKTLGATFDALKTIGGGPAKARLLSDNLDAWNERWAQLETAKTSIDASYFIFEKDPFGFAYLGFLLKKQMEGVKVRVMTDAVADTFGKNGFKMPLRGKDYLQELVNQGGEAYIYHPIWQRPFDAFRFDYSVLASNHDKIQVVDGKYGVTGGRNIAKDYFAHPDDLAAAWRDIDVSLEGEGPAKALTASFDAELNDSFARRVKPDRFGNWVKRDLELVGAYEMMDLWLKAPAFSAEDKALLRKEPSLKGAIVEGLVNQTVARLSRAPNGRELEFLKKNAASLVDHLEARGSRPAFEARKLEAHESETKILDQTSAAGTRVNDFAGALTSLIDAATKRVVIENPYVVLTEDMMKAMERAAKRGVEIIIGTNSPLSTDSAVTQAFFLEDWAYVLARIPGSRIFVATGDRKFHGKSAIIDDEISLVTTYNLDLLSGNVNSEVGAAVKSKAFAKDLMDAFLADKDNPKNGVLEYTIQKDAHGGAVLKDGKPVPTFGPEDHLPKAILEDYAKRRKLWAHTLRDNVPYLAPLRHPQLTDLR